MTLEETKEEPENSAGVLTRSGNETTHNTDILILWEKLKNLMKNFVDLRRINLVSEFNETFLLFIHVLSNE